MAARPSIFFLALAVFVLEPFRFGLAFGRRKDRRYYSRNCARCAMGLAERETVRARRDLSQSRRILPIARRWLRIPMRFF